MNLHPEDCERIKKAALAQAIKDLQPKPAPPSLLKVSHE